LKEIPLTQGKVTTVDDVYYEELSKYKWQAKKDKSGCFYAECMVHLAKNKRQHLHMARMVLEMAGFNGTGMVAHHKSHDTLDNRLQNLAFISQEDNKRDRKNNATGFAGVNWKKENNKYCAQIAVQGKKYHIGLYDDPYTAALARIAWMEERGIDTTFSMHQLSQIRGEQVDEGLASVNDANNIYRGRTV
jgi:hypothetical protein